MSGLAAESHFNNSDRIVSSTVPEMAGYFRGSRGKARGKVRIGRRLPPEEVISLCPMIGLTLLFSISKQRLAE